MDTTTALAYVWASAGTKEAIVIKSAKLLITTIECPGLMLRYLLVVKVAAHG